MIKLETTPLQGLELFTGFKSNDDRGNFFKVFNNELDFVPKQVFTTNSHKDVIRGMHYQNGRKIICVLQGSVLDVVLDVRSDSKTYGQHFSTIIKANDKAIFMIEGLAHGFKSLEENTILLYLQDQIHDPKTDLGFHYQSFGCDWECAKPILSARDEILAKFKI
jgi:dTDP-4-dehydrorhamnose 3,5-epimerase/CDP-3, 6-dideoxy-D-glycero-D-glycero-4-hexulose-5-epimerase